MWFIFPQLKGLGVSAIAKHFGLESKAEALAYWQHPILGARLLECTKLVMAQPNMSALNIFGTTDALKFRSCMTLFTQVAPEEAAFKEALTQFFDGKPDECTLKFL